MRELKVVRSSGARALVLLIDIVSVEINCLFVAVQPIRSGYCRQIAVEVLQFDLDVDHQVEYSSQRRERLQPEKSSRRRIDNLPGGAVEAAPVGFSICACLAKVLRIAT